MNETSLSNQNIQQNITTEHKSLSFQWKCKQNARFWYIEF